MGVNNKYALKNTAKIMAVMLSANLFANFNVMASGLGNQCKIQSVNIKAEKAINLHSIKERMNCVKQYVLKNAGIISTYCAGLAMLAKIVSLEIKTSEQSRKMDKLQESLDAQLMDMNAQRRQIYSQSRDIDAQRMQIDAQRRDIADQRIDIAGHRMQIDAQLRDMNAQRRQIDAIRSEILQRRGISATPILLGSENESNNDANIRMQNMESLIWRLEQEVHRGGQRERDYFWARHLKIDEGCKVSKIYSPNLISRINVDINETYDIRTKLVELCRQFDCTEGILPEDSVSNGAGSQSAWDYFFNGINGRYRELDQEHRKIFAQCIYAMHQNKDNQEWHGVIDSVLHSLSTHGGHCAWRAEALTNSMDSTLSEFLSQNERGQDSTDPEDFMRKVLTRLKDKIITEAESDYQVRLRESFEPLDKVNKMVARLKFLMGMSDRDVSRVYGGDCIDKADEYFKKYSSRKCLIKRLKGVIHESFEEDTRSRFLSDIGRKQLSFAEYCNFAGKKQENIEDIIRRVTECEDPEDEADRIELERTKAWLNGEINLTLDESIKNLASFAYDLGLEVTDENGAWELTDGGDGLKFMVMCFDHHYFE